MSPEVPARPFPTARPWPEGERIFWADKRWLGADNAYTVALGGNRTLWLFADSFVSDRPGPRTDATAVYGNTIAVMTGSDPSTAEMEFYWGTSGCGPTTFFPPLESDGPGWRLMWPGHGIRLHAGLLLFFQVVDVTAERNDEVRFIGWTARLVTNPEDEPPLRIVSRSGRSAELVRDRYWIRPGTHHKNHVYALFVQPKRGDQRLSGALVPHQSRAKRDLHDPKWLCGQQCGWVPQSKVQGTPSAVLTDAKTEITVHRDTVTGKFAQVHGSDYLSARIMWRRAPTLVGPWSKPVRVYDPRSSPSKTLPSTPSRCTPILRGADSVATYVALPLDRTRLLNDQRLYRPPRRAPRLLSGIQVSLFNV